MSTELRPTPETDELCWMQDWEGYRGEIVNSNFARRLERERDSAKTLNKTLLDQLEAQAVRIESMLKHDATRLESDSIVGSCDCQTKTPEVKYHKPGCKYRLISERDEAREEAGRLLVVESQQKDQIEAMRKTLIESEAYQAGLVADIEAMREAIKEAATTLESFLTLFSWPELDAPGIKETVAKLKPFIKP